MVTQRTCTERVGRAVALTFPAHTYRTPEQRRRPEIFAPTFFNSSQRPPAPFPSCPSPSPPLLLLKGLLLLLSYRAAAANLCCVILGPLPSPTPPTPPHPTPHNHPPTIIRPSSPPPALLPFPLSLSDLCDDYDDSVWCKKARDGRPTKTRKTEAGVKKR